jgi:hypothetical protein
MFKNNWYIILLGILFIMGLIFYLANKSNLGRMWSKELFTGMKSPTSECPNILVQEGSKIILKNTKLAEIPGVNPVVFNNLEDYVEFTKWQRSQGINCPVLYLQKSVDAQDNEVYKIRPHILDPRAGLPAYRPELEKPGADDPYENSLLIDSNRNDAPYNNNTYPGYDPDNQYVGLETPLDKIGANDPASISDNPMNPNWGGRAVTERDIKRGKFKDDEVWFYKNDD